MTIGDVLAVIAGVAGVAGSIWALLLCTTLVLHHMTEVGKEIAVTRPLSALFTGLALSATVGVAAVSIMNRSNGLFKLIGIISSLSLIAVAVLGAAGLAALVADRVEAADPEITRIAALARGAGLMVGCALVPLLGWFLIAPALFFMAFGTGARALLALRRERPAVVPFASPAIEIESHR